MNYFCNKCGYYGPVQVGHQMQTMGVPCPYYAAPAPTLSDTERQNIREQFGLDEATNEPR